MVGVPFLDKIRTFTSTYASARLYVEWAPGADLTDADGSGWSWVDISSDVLQSDGKTITISPMGRSDAFSHSQPAGMSLTLDNRAGTYSRGPQSSNYPKVRLNVPIKVSVSMTGLDADKKIRFQGYTNSLQPGWDQTGGYAIVSLQAAGVSRRLTQGTPALLSPLNLYFSTYPGGQLASAYWPMEDTSGTSFFAGGQTYAGIDGFVTNPGLTAPMYYSSVTLAQYEGATGSLALPVFTASTTLQGAVQERYSGALSNSEVDFLLYVPSAPAADTAVLRIHTTSSDIIRWELVIPAGSSTNMRVDGYDSTATKIVNTSTAFGATVGEVIHVRFMQQQSGGNIQWQLVVFRFASGLTGGSVSSTTAGTVGLINQISMLASAGMNGASMGHIVVFDEYNHSYSGAGNAALTGNFDEFPDVRMERLTTSAGTTITVAGLPINFMGIQGQEDFLTLMQESEDVDQGILYDGLGPGFGYTSNPALTNRAVDMTLVQTDLMPPFQPVDDDQLVANYVTATRKNGGSATYEQQLGNLGTRAIARYQDSVSGLNLGSDYSLLSFASRRASIGTVDGYRYPSLSLDFRKIPTHANEWAALTPGFRMDITGIESYVTQHPSGTISLLVLGWQEQLSRFVWEATLNCVLYAPYRVIKLGADSGPYDEFVEALDSEASSLSSSALASATSLSVATTTGHPLWTTASANYPVDINVGGWKVSLTAVSGASSPQTFTISALPAAVSSGAEVKLWYPPLFDLEA